MRIDEHHRHVTGLSLIQMNFLWEILCLSFKDHTFSVVGNIFFIFGCFLQPGCYRRIHRRPRCEGKRDMELLIQRRRGL